MGSMRAVLRRDESGELHWSWIDHSQSSRSNPATRRRLVAGLHSRLQLATAARDWQVTLFWRDSQRVRRPQVRDVEQYGKRTQDNIKKRTVRSGRSICHHQSTENEACPNLAGENASATQGG